MELDTRLIEMSDDELMEGVDGGDVDRVLNELRARGGADARLAVLLQRAVLDYYATVDPESCI